MKKIFFLFSVIVGLLATSVVFTSCGDDEEEPVSMIVGVWKQPYNNGPESVLTLNADGTFNFFVNGSGLTGSGNYTYDEITRTLALFYTSGGSGDRTYIVRSLTDSYMVLMDHNGDDSNWRKDSSGTTTNSQADETDNHESVDLGLPSGTLWATCNVGASKPEDYGNYYAWGETQPKSDYTWNTYKYCRGSHTTLTKYCTNSSYGTVDNKTELEPEDDAATANWGRNWQTPSIDQYKELFNSNNTTWTFEYQNEVLGCMIVSKKNENRLFLPLTGMRSETSFYDGKSTQCDCYWSRSLDSNGNAACLCKGLYVMYGILHIDPSSGSRSYGLTVRPVRKK